MEKFVTKEDLQRLEKSLTEQHEKRIQMISAHYSDVLKSNQTLHADVCASNQAISTKLDGLVEQLKPILDAQKFIVTLHAFLKWLGLPFTFIGLVFYWVWKNI